MVQLGEQRRCEWIGCQGIQTVEEIGNRVIRMPQQVDAGRPFPTQGYKTWVCSEKPGEHFNVVGFEHAERKKCRCGGTMLHSWKAREIEPEDLTRKPTRDYAKVTPKSGWFCLENPTHFEPD